MPSFSASFTAVISGVGRRQARRTPALSTAAAAEGPSCLFVGPVDTASKEMLEALYQQARNSYYSGKPLIVDAMFDKVELQLRLHGSKSVVKYPRCSIMRHSTYADAEEDPSQVLALATVWILLLAFGSFSFLVPTILAISAALEDTFNSCFFLSDKKYPFDLSPTLNSALFVGLGISVGYPTASSSVEALKGLWMKKLVALKGSCPNCGEEVFAFMKAENSILRPHGTPCHVCQSRLEFRGKVEWGQLYGSFAAIVPYLSFSNDATRLKSVRSNLQLAMDADVFMAGFTLSQKLILEVGV